MSLGGREWVSGRSRHWFDTRSFLAIEPYERAVEQLTAWVQAGEPIIGVAGRKGSGKSSVIREALRRLRRPQRSTVLIDSPRSAEDFTGALLDGLRDQRLDRIDGGGGSWRWRLLENALQVTQWSGKTLAIAVDSCRTLDDPEALFLFGQLQQAADASSGRISLIVVDADASPAATLRLAPLTRAEASAFILTRWRENADAAVRELTPSALTWLHALSRGLPCALDRLIRQLRDLAESDRRWIPIDDEWLESRFQQFRFADLESLDGVETVADSW